MPLSEYTVQPVQELHVPKTDGVPRDKICTATNQASMAGILTQITLITSYANEMFGNLVKEATETYSKIKDLSQRTSKLRQGLPEMEQFFSSSDIISQMSSAKRSAYVSKNEEKSNLFDRESIPHALQTIYDAKCKPPPKLHLLDPYADDGRPVLTKYTYPQFFLDEWIAEQQKQVEILKAERRQRRKDRAARRREKAGKEGPDLLKPQVRKLRKVRYDPQTGERIIEEEDVTVAPTPRTIAAQPTPGGEDRKDKRTSVRKQGRTDMTTSAPAQQPTTPRTPRGDPSMQTGAPLPPSVPPPPLPTIAPPPPISQPPPLPQDSYVPAPINIPPPPPNVPAPMLMEEDIGSAPPPPPPPLNVSMPSINEEIMDYDAPPPPPAPMLNNTSSPMRQPGLSVSGAVPPPPPPPMMLDDGAPTPSFGAPVPPPPPMANMNSSGSGGDLMSQIQNAKLKAAGEAPKKEKPQDMRSGLLESIRQGMALKSANERKVPEKEADKPAETANLSVAQILARRIAIIGGDSDSESEGEDNNDEWSD